MNTIVTNVTQSNLMKAYRAARAARVFEPKRLNRAFGIVQSNNTKLLPDGRLDVNVNDWHMASTHDCDCPDHQGIKNTRGEWVKFPNKYCKHIIAACLVVKARRIAKTK